MTPAAHAQRRSRLAVSPRARSRCRNARNHRRGPWGAGEPTAAVVPSAISNAVFDAIGVRLRSVPFVPQKVLAGLKAA